MSPVPAIAVAGDSELIESTGVGGGVSVVIGGCSRTVGRVGASPQAAKSVTIAISTTLVHDILPPGDPEIRLGSAAPNARRSTSVRAL